MIGLYREFHRGRHSFLLEKGGASPIVGKSICTNSYMFTWGNEI